MTVEADFAPAGSVDRGPFFYLWIFAMIVSSCYTYTWDIRMDWGLMDANAGEENRSGYYFCFLRIHFEADIFCTDI